MPTLYLPFPESGGKEERRRRREREEKEGGREGKEVVCLVYTSLSPELYLPFPPTVSFFPRAWGKEGKEEGEGVRPIPPLP
jgi:hypothetical protein